MRFFLPVFDFVFISTSQELVGKGILKMTSFVSSGKLTR